MSILCPSSFAELQDMLEAALFKMDGPVAVRYPRGGEGEFRDLTQGEEVCLREGSEISLIAYGTMINEALDAAKLLAAEGIAAEVIKVNQIRSDRFELIMKSLRKTGRVLIAEEVCGVGCLGRRILARAGQLNVCLHAARSVNLGEGIVVHGSREQLLHDYSLDAASIAETAKELIGRGEK